MDPEQADVPQLHDHGEVNYWDQWPEDLQDIAEMLELIGQARQARRDHDQHDVLLRLELGAPEGYEDIPQMAAALLQHAIGAGDQEVEVDFGPEPPQQLRRGPRRPYTVTTRLRETNWFERSLEWENKWFRRAYRMSKRTFGAIVNRLQNNPIFQSQGRRPQRPVIYQFGVFLLRYGLIGSPALEAAMKSGVGEGTVFLYCERVIRAIREIGVECVGWPNEERKEEIKTAFEARIGLYGIIGVVDGSLIPLAREPNVGARTYYCRKGYPAINVQAVVDHECCFTAFESGWPGSRPDRFVWLRSYPWEKREQLFEEGEFLLADAGYPTTPYLLCPYMRNEMHTEEARKRRFNVLLSKSRVLVECAFGRLKARFPALTLMGAVHDIKDLYRSVEALFILHNLCHGYHDTVNGIPDAYTQAILDRLDRRMRNGDDGAGEEDELFEAIGHLGLDDILDDHEPNNVPLLAEGRAFREDCLNLIVPRRR